MCFVKFQLFVFLMAGNECRFAAAQCRAERNGETLTLGTCRSNAWRRIRTGSANRMDNCELIVRQ